MAWMSGVAISGAMAGAGSDDVSPSARAAMACSTVSIVVSGEPTNPASASLMAQSARRSDFGQVEERTLNACLIIPGPLLTTALVDIGFHGASVTLVPVENVSAAGRKSGVE